MIYITSVASELTGLHATTIYRYEREGLIKIARKNNRRRMSNLDIAWLKRIHYLIHSWGFRPKSLRLVLGSMCRKTKFWAKCKYVVVESTSRDPCWMGQSSQGQLSDDDDCCECEVYKEVINRIMNGSIDELLANVSNC